MTAVFDRTGDEVRRFHPAPESAVVNALAPGTFVIEVGVFSPDGRTIATAESHRNPLRSRVSLWDWDREDPQQRVIETHGGAFALAFDPSGATLAVGRQDGYVEVYDVESLERLRRFPATEGALWALAYSPDGSLIATAGNDGSVRLFDREGSPLLILRAHELTVAGLSFSADGTRLASASADGVVRVWALDLDDLSRIAQDELTRDLTEDECRQYLHLEDGC
jgi:WD40 repeat protein